MALTSAALDGGGEESAQRRQSVPAIEKAAIVLDVLAATERELTFSEIASRVAMARSSLHDVCSSLVRTGLVEKTAEGRYTIGLKLVELSRHRLASMELVSAFQRVARSQGPLGETVVLSVLSGADVVYVSFIDGSRALAVRYEIGMRLPAPFTASGKAMLATLPEARVRELVGRQVVNPHSDPPKRKTAKALLAELAEARERGFSLDDEETAPGMSCLGAPVFAAGSDEAVGAVAVSLVKNTPAWYDVSSSDSIRQLAAAITVELGGRPAW